MPIKIFFLPSRAIASLNQMPEESGVYYMTALWRLFYVGKAVNLRRRLTARHQRYKQIKILTPFARVHYKVLPKHQISAYEREEIKSLKPCWNYTRVPKFWGLLSQFIWFWLRFCLFTALVVIAIAYLIYLYLR
ncbi:putative endonuclease [Synechococcus sp. PCC 7502]|uniref:endonuclease n=1 Tax=Synechococcus sp. PCC 7502 TaxID=1173263 RepID=UPI00029FF748|nr:endonuclease [Synechococcus sp. PCC 7502]AFY75394.1 putative endonuclease [Synechococcus sp. PCC 7502]